MNKQLVIPFVIGYEDKKETFHFVANVPDVQFPQNKDIIQYIRVLENHILDEETGFKIKDVCNFETDLNKYISMFRNLGYGIDENKIIFEKREMFDLWLYLINFVTDNPFVYFEEIEVNDIEFRSEGNI